MGSRWEIKALAVDGGTELTATIKQKGSVVAPRTEAARIHRIFDRTDERLTSDRNL